MKTDSRQMDPVEFARPAGKACGPSDDWRAILAESLRDPADLCQRLGLPTTDVDLSAEFSMLVPEPLFRRIEPGNPTDPILLQVLPRKEERVASLGFTTDPVGENNTLSPDGTLSKYRGRSLIVTSKTCGVHCRFCFRRHAPLQSGVSGGFHSDFADRFEADPTLHEAILSGGDPLTFDDGSLATLLERLDRVESLHRIRIHTRMPIVIPQRVTDRLIEILRGGRTCRTRRVVVLHVNHPNELDKHVECAIGRLAQSGSILLSQSVLLRGINDSEPVLAELFERLVDLGVVPYYLHQLDRVAGGAHFEVDPSMGKELIARLRTRLPGYAVPRYVREVPGSPGKVVLV